MLHSQTHLRTRPIGAGHLRAFEAVARHLNFRAAGEELALTQSAVSRQIQGLEEEVGVPLFLRHTRAVELTSAGAQLLLAVSQALPRVDAAVRQIRQSAGRRSVSLTTFASFASMWLIPRLEAFQRDHPDIDIRIDASDAALDLEMADVDIALRYGPPATMPTGALRLFGEQLTPVASPWLLKSSGTGGLCLRRPEDLAGYALIEAGDANRTHLEWLTWRRWLQAQAGAQAGAQALAVFQLRLPDGAGRPDRPGRGVGTAAPGGREHGQRRSGGSVAGFAHGLTDGLLAHRRPTQRGTPGNPRFL
jgi:LysR family glycine cleavage system transcriptional activator